MRPTSTCAPDRNGVRRRSATLAATAVAIAAASVFAPLGCGGGTEQDCETACGTADPCAFLPTRDNSTGPCGPACHEEVSFDDEAGCSAQSAAFFSCTSMLANACDALVESSTAPCHAELNAYVGCVLGFCAKHPQSNMRVCR